MPLQRTRFKFRPNRIVVIPSIQTQVLWSLGARFRQAQAHGIQGLGQEFHIMPIGSGDDESER
jgi:hypothetical protein